MLSFFESYQRELRPRSFFDLLPKEILEEFLTGFYNDLRWGIVLLAVEYDEDGRMVDTQQVVPKPSPTSPPHQGASAICNTVASILGRKQCDDCDEEAVRKVLREEESLVGPFEAEPYPCWLGLTDMWFPLFVDGRVRAVLLAGQLPPEDSDGVNRLEVNLRDLAQKVGGAGEARINSLLPVAKASPDQTALCKERLTKLGRMIQTITYRLHAGDRAMADRKCVQEAAAFLTDADISNPTGWWNKCRELMAGLAGLLGLPNVEVYTRKHSRYQLRISTEYNEEDIWLPMEEVLEKTRPDQITPLHRSDTNHAHLFRRAGWEADTVTVFRRETRGPELAECSSLIVFEGQIAGDELEFTLAFCRAIAARVDISSLIFHKWEIQEGFQFDMADTAHSLRTPIAALQMDIEAIRANKLVAADGTLVSRLEDCGNRLLGIQEDIRDVLERVADTPQLVTLTDVVETAINWVTPTTPFGVRITRQGTWPDNIHVRVSYKRILWALVNLLDNAVKYSYRGTAMKSREVYVWVEHQGTQVDWARVRIQNYGIGIPQPLLATLRSGLIPGVRGEVEDDTRLREGTGWGIPTARRAFLEAGGGFDITSWPTEAAAKIDTPKFHRYLTEVCCRLPIHEEAIHGTSEQRPRRHHDAP
ncbi:MAG: PocR ligand-binding domain-containing protein [Planctomycetota bacterium]|nr:PocR ligand-binding domain-containing protein [Planctomycetota bacterium]